MVATNAFGLGIDKPDIRFVLHYQMPAGLDAYYQESGAPGRDGELARCTLLFLRARQGGAAVLPGRAAIRPRGRRRRSTARCASRPGDGDAWTLARCRQALGRPQVQAAGGAGPAAPAAGRAAASATGACACWRWARRPTRSSTLTGRLPRASARPTARCWSAWCSTRRPGHAAGTCCSPISRKARRFERCGIATTARASPPPMQSASSTPGRHEIPCATLLRRRRRSLRSTPVRPCAFRATAAASWRAQIARP